MKRKVCKKYVMGKPEPCGRKFWSRVSTREYCWKHKAAKP